MSTTRRPPPNRPPRSTHISGVNEVDPWQIEEDMFEEFGIEEDLGGGVGHCVFGTGDWDLLRIC